MFDNINRLEIIDEKGRSYVEYNCKIKASLQDEGKTLKIFVQKRTHSNYVPNTKDSKG